MSRQSDILIDLKQLVFETLDRSDVHVYLFGSWAREEQKQSSDIDIGLEASPPISRKKWLEMQEKLEDSSIPYHVDLVDMNHADPVLTANIRIEGIQWTDSGRDSNQLNVL